MLSSLVPIRYGLKSLLVVVAVVAILIAYPSFVAMREQRIKHLVIGAGGIVNTRSTCFGFFEVVYGFGMCGSEEACRLIPTLTASPFVERIVLNDTNVDNESMTYIARVHHLKVLDISGTKVTDSGLERLGPLQHLISLVLRDLDVSDGCIARLVTRCPHLICLDLTGTGAGELTLHALKGLKELETCWLSETRIIDDDLALLNGLSSLSELLLDKCNISDTGIRKLNDLPSLSGISLSGTHVTPSGVNLLFGQLRSLVSVTLPSGAQRWGPIPLAAPNDSTMNEIDSD